MAYKFNPFTGKLDIAGTSGGGGSGTVTSITAGTGLTGGTITTSGTVAVSYGTTASTAVQGNDTRVVNAVAKTGDTMTGKLIAAADDTASKLNIGNSITGTNPATTVNGDVWITNGNRLAYRSNSTVYNTAQTNLQNTFNQPQAVDASSATTALRVTQRGAGEALRVEDDTTPDATAFVVSNAGKVGVGVTPDATVALSVDTTGVKFGDGTIQTTAATGSGTGTVTSITAGTGLTGGTITTSGTIAVNPVYNLEIHVSKDGNDTTGDGTLLNPVLTITKALTLVGASRNTVVVHPGGYTENVTVSSTNTTITTLELTGANTLLTGTLTLNAAARVSGLKMSNLTITGSGNTYISNCTVDTRVIKSGTNYVEIINSELQCTAGIQITNTGTVSIIGNKCWGVTVSSVGASVLIKDCFQVIDPRVTGGTLQIDGCAIFASTPATAAVTSTVFSNITLANSFVLNSVGTNVESVSLGGNYSILNLVYDKANSTFTGTNLNAVDYFSVINAEKIGVNTVADATVGLKLDSTGVKFNDGTIQTTAATGGGTVTSVTGTSPIASSGGATPAISIANAAADGTTKGAAAFNASDFEATAGVVSIDYTNGQAASASAKGFLTATDWTTFNSKGAGTVTSVTATSPITSTGGAAPVISTSMATNKLLGRSTASTGVAEEIAIGTGLTLSSGTLNATSSAAPTDIQVFSTPGTFTWTKPLNAKSVHVAVISGGGGGGSGQMSAAASPASGGGGGGAGARSFVTLSAALLGASENGNVGAGGAGGASVTSVGLGINGSVGTISNFGLWAYADRGGNGNGGAAGAGGGAGSGGGRAIFTGGTGANGSATAGGTNAGTNTGAGGGGGGGGGTPGSVSAGTGGNGGLSTLFNGSATAPAAGVNGPDVPTNTPLNASGGGGGTASFTAPAMAGGNGGLYGAGGGGGGGGSGFASGKGGNGSQGIVVVTTYF